MGGHPPTNTSNDHAYVVFVVCFFGEGDVKQKESMRKEDVMLLLAVEMEVEHVGRV